VKYARPDAGLTEIRRQGGSCRNDARARRVSALPPPGIPLAKTQRRQGNRSTVYVVDPWFLLRVLGGLAREPKQPTVVVDSNGWSAAWTRRHPPSPCPSPTGERGLSPGGSVPPASLRLRDSALGSSSREGAKGTDRRRTRLRPGFSFACLAAWREDPNSPRWWWTVMAGVPHGHDDIPPSPCPSPTGGRGDSVRAARFPPASLRLRGSALSGSSREGAKAPRGLTDLVEAALCALASLRLCVKQWPP